MDKLTSSDLVTYQNMHENTKMHKTHKIQDIKIHFNTLSNYDFLNLANDTTYWVALGIDL